MIIIAAHMILIPARCHVVKSRNVPNVVGASLGRKIAVPAKQSNEQRGGETPHRRAILLWVSKYSRLKGSILLRKII